MSFIHFLAWGRTIGNWTPRFVMHACHAMCQPIELNRTNLSIRTTYTVYIISSYITNDLLCVVLTELCVRRTAIVCPEKKTISPENAVSGCSLVQQTRKHLSVYLTIITPSLGLKPHTSTSRRRLVVMLVLLLFIYLSFLKQIPCFFGPRSHFVHDHTCHVVPLTDRVCSLETSRPTYGQIASTTACPIWAAGHYRWPPHRTKKVKRINADGGWSTCHHLLGLVGLHVTVVLRRHLLHAGLGATRLLRIKRVRIVLQNNELQWRHEGEREWGREGREGEREGAKKGEK